MDGGERCGDFTRLSRKQVGFACLLDD